MDIPSIEGVDISVSPWGPGGGWYEVTNKATGFKLFGPHPKDGLLEFLEKAAELCLTVDNK